nr:MAG TPA: hypothetical protein [Caudoviricetes sp.]
MLRGFGVDKGVFVCLGWGVVGVTCFGVDVLGMRGHY